MKDKACFVILWDSLIIATASQSNAEKILMEDLNNGQVIEGVLIENPFL